MVEMSFFDGWYCGVLDIALSVNPFFESISEAERAEYEQDYEKELRKHPKVVHENENGKVQFLYERIVVCGIKP